MPQHTVNCCLQITNTCVHIPAGFGHVSRVLAEPCMDVGCFEANVWPDGGDFNYVWWILVVDPINHGFRQAAIWKMYPDACRSP